MNIIKVTEINNSDIDSLYVYINTDTFEKYLYKKINKFLFPYTDVVLLNYLNNKDKIVYGTFKDKVKKTISILGVVLTIGTVEPYLAEGLSFSLKRINSYSISSSVDLNDEFINSFKSSLWKNDDFTEEEKTFIFNDYEEKINKYGYLLDENDKKYILSQIENVKVNRNVKLPRWASGDYILRNINIKEDDLVTVRHEVYHALSDHGLLVGTINGYGMGYSINEDVNSSFNDDNAYNSYDALKLSLLIGKETLLKAYLKGNINDIINSIVDNCEGISRYEAIKYICMKDVELFVDHYKVIEKYSLPNSFYSEKDELYNKMFKAKYGYDFKESLIYNNIGFTNPELIRYNFLNDKMGIVMKKGGFQYYIGCDIKDCTKNINDTEYMNKVSYKFFDGNYNSFMSIIIEKDELLKYNSMDDFYKDYSNKYSFIDDVEDKLKFIFSGFTINEENINKFMDFFVPYVLSKNLSPKETAAYFRTSSSYLNVYEHDENFYNHMKPKLNNIKNMYTKSLNERLKGINDEVFDYYNNTTISYIRFEPNDIENNILSNSYYRLEETDNYRIDLENRMITLRVDEDTIPYETKYDDSYISFHKENLNSNDNIYIYEMSDKVYDNFDKSKLEIYQAIEVKNNINKIK